jgi:hypothetical protein
MRVPERETIYVNPDIYQGETGTSAIADVPMNTPIKYGENPNLTVNQFGETVVVQTPIPLNPTPTSTPIATPKEQAEQLVSEIKETLAEIKAEEDTKPKKDFGTIIEDNKALNVAKTNPTPVKPKTNYLLYGAVGIGAVIVLIGIFKK